MLVKMEIFDVAAVGSIDTSGISRLEEVKKIIDRRGLSTYMHTYKDKTAHI